MAERGSGGVKESKERGATTEGRTEGPGFRAQSFCERERCKLKGYTVPRKLAELSPPLIGS